MLRANSWFSAAAATKVSLNLKLNLAPVDTVVLEIVELEAAVQFEEPDTTRVIKCCISSLLEIRFNC